MPLLACERRKMEAKLSQQNILKLINLYHSHPLLWDMSNKSYRRKDLKRKAYESIAKEMDMMVDVVKKKIRNLRTTYTNENRKMNAKKSGSGAEEQYISSLTWYTTMSFLDNSIIIRKRMDSSKIDDDLNSESFEEIEFVDFEKKPPSKRPRKTTATATDKKDEVLEKNINENATEFTVFGASIAQQLSNMSKEPAYELMIEIQSLIGKKKIEEIRKNRCRLYLN